MAKKTESIPAESDTEQPYYLQRAHIKDFRSIRDAVVEFKPGLNIIIGPNGSGKTNFVRCIDSGIRPSKNKFVGGNDSTFLINGEHETLVNYQQSITNKNNRLTPEISQDLRTRQRVIVTIDNFIVEGSSLADALYDKQDNITLSSAFNNRSTILINHGVPDHYGAATLSLDLSVDDSGWLSFANEQEIFIPTSIYNSRIAIYLSIFERAIENKLSEDFVLSITTHKLNYILSSLRPTLRKFSPIHDIRFSSTLQAYNNVQQQEILIQGLKIEFKVNNAWLPFSALSSGTQRVFYIISEITSLNSIELEDYDKIEEDFSHLFSKTILLEEPELGIHPDQLEKLLSFLREQSKKHQLIITTHSPQVLDMLNDDELDRITICELHKTKGTQFRKLKKTQIAAAKQYMSTQGLYLSDYWRYGSLESTK